VSAIDALNKIKHGSRRYDLLLLDYNLNDRYGINGLDIFEAARQVNPSVKGVMVSAYGEHLIKERSRQKGIKTFIDKPFLISDLVDSIDNAINNNLVRNSA
jgi:CheY-like chemotaxis protein